LPDHDAASPPSRNTTSVVSFEVFGFQEISAANFARVVDVDEVVVDVDEVVVDVDEVVEEDVDAP
jgi:hypothetical protein